MIRKTKYFKKNSASCQALLIYYNSKGALHTGMHNAELTFLLSSIEQIPQSTQQAAFFLTLVGAILHYSACQTADGQ